MYNNNNDLSTSTISKHKRQRRSISIGRKGSTSLLIGIGAIVLLNRPSEAANPANWKVFNSTSTQNWTTAGSWTTGIPTSGTTLVINFNPALSGTTTTSGNIGSTFISNNDFSSIILNQLNLSGQSSGTTSGTSRTITIAGGTLVFDGTSPSINNTTSTNGAALVNYVISAPIQLNSDLSLTGNGTGLLTSSGGISAGTSGTKTLGTSGSNVTISGAITDGSGTVAVTQGGAGTLTLSSSGNTYSGDTTISSGTLILAGTGGTATLGSSSGTLYLSGGTLSTTVDRSVTSNNILNNIVVTSNSVITTASTSNVNLVFGGTLSGTGGALTLTAATTSSANFFDVRFTGATNFTMDRPIVLTNTGGGTTRLSDFNTAGTTHTYNGVISGNGAFRRSASTGGTGGTTIFTAANTFTGAVTVNDGTLLANNTLSIANPASSTNSATGTGNVVVGSSVSAVGSLGGSGSVFGAVDLQGIVTPGTNGANSIGTLTTGAQTFHGGAGYTLDITPSAAGSAANDLDYISGNLSLNSDLTSGTKKFTIYINRVGSYSSPTIGSTPFAITHENNALTTGNGGSIALATLQSYFTFSDPSGQSYTLTEVADGSGYDLDLSAAVPELGSITLFGSAVSGMLLSRRRKGRGERDALRSAEALFV